MHVILTCVSQAHDERLLILAAVICTLGVYASSAIASQAARCEGRQQKIWAAISIVAAGCTAWATHMVALLAFLPGMASGFDPLLTLLSLILVIAGIATGIGLSLGQRRRWRRFLAGVVLGSSITALHYVGQVGYLVTGRVSWDLELVTTSVLVSLTIFGLAMMTAAERNRTARRLASPLLVAAIAVLHLCGMTAATLVFDPTVVLPSSAIPPSVIAPIIAAVCFGLLVLAFMGLRMTLAAQAQQRKDRQRLRELASLALEGLAICDAGVITMVNQSLERLSGMDSADLTGRTMAALLPGIVLEELPEQEERDAELYTADGQGVPVRVLRKEAVLGHKRQMVVAVRDQRERLRTEARMRTLAFTDTLTGLPNRARLIELIDYRLALWREHHQTFAILLVDLDRFKLVNDTLGHGAGDILLRMVAARLSAATSADDIVGRLGGDEFAVLQIASIDIDAPQRLAQKIVDAMRQPFLVNGQSASIGASVGIALAPAHGDVADVLLQQADLAMYQAKAEGKAAFRTFEPILAQRIQVRRALEDDMRHALKAGHFEVHYQPLLSPLSGRVTGAEALVRWRHMTRGFIPPTEFIPLAEEAGLIGELGEWVLRTACRQACDLPDEVKMAVNLSPIQFRDDGLPDLVKAVLSDTGLAPGRLELEITEGVMLHDEQRTLGMLSRLREWGIGLAMDDFGTGYASLSYLRRFPFSKLKVDRSFIRQLPFDDESAAIVRAILSMAACLGLTTTVEGVETAEQYAFFASEPSLQVQGYYVNRPVPFTKFLEFLDLQASSKAA